jgi:6-pyruvoyltetrahydropterin/6-carboxytetrahydropterin synthase
MAYRITKTYGHDLGLSACFRQPLAQSHCQFLHGYALSFKFTFEADKLDENNWVLDFGSLKPLKQWLCDNFDHKLVIAQDDPALERLLALGDGRGRYDSAPVADVAVVPFVGCEGFARMAWEQAEAIARERSTMHRLVRLVEVEVREHGANSAIYLGEQ